MIVVFLIRNSESYLIFNYEKKIFFVLFSRSILTRHIIFDNRNKATFSRFSEMKTSWTSNYNCDVYESQSRCFRKMSIDFMKIDVPLKRLLFTSQVSRNKNFKISFFKRSVIIYDTISFSDLKIEKSKICHVLWKMILIFNDEIIFDQICFIFEKFQIKHIFFWNNIFVSNFFF